MATVPFVLMVDKKGRKVVKWGPLTTTNNDGQWYPWAGHYPEKTLHVYGTAGAGLHLKLEGTNEEGTPSNDVDLQDATEDVIDITSLPAVTVVLPNTSQVRPHVEGGDGTTSLYALLEMTT